jgi:DNA modification methylase
MKIEMWPIDRPKPYEKNPRINDQAVDVVAPSIQEFGFRQPIVVDQAGVIIVGHTRLKAAQKLGLKKVPVHVATGLTPAQIRAYRIADNQTATIADWNPELLGLEIGDLKALDYDLDLLGFGADELATLLNPNVVDGLCDPDEIPAPPDEATTEPGDLWILGEHRLLCGDSSKPEEVDRLLDGVTVQMVNTDPPYGVAVEPRSNNAIAAGNSSFQSTSRKKGQKLRAKDRPLANDSVTGDDFDRLLDAWFGNAARVLDPGRAFYMWGGYANLSSYPPALERSGLYFSQAIVWDKQHPVIGRKDFMGSYELAFYGWKQGASHRFYGPNNARDIWAVKKLHHQQMEHLTAKPAELAVRAMQYSTVPGENVLDLFGGSGSTLIAAQQTGRKAFLMELDPLYADVIVDRYQRFTGHEGMLERTGKSPILMKPREEAMR